MRNKLSCLNQSADKGYQSRITRFTSFNTSYRAVILFLVITIPVLSSPAYSDVINNLSCDASAIEMLINDIKMNERELNKDDTIMAEGVSKIAQKNIPVGCDLITVIVALSNSGFKLSQSKRPHILIASIFLAKGLFGSTELEIEIEHESGHTKMVTGRLMYRYL